ncbi:hypothetical protein Mapa_004585 [Marchantia paleacea]|nr:hypothetical protein Mapa_004585 [Marchantia paleacea]
MVPPNWPLPEVEDLAISRLNSSGNALYSSPRAPPICLTTNGKTMHHKLPGTQPLHVQTIRRALLSETGGST